METSELESRLEVLAFCISHMTFPPMRGDLVDALKALAKSRPELADAVTSQLKVLTEARAQQERSSLPDVPMF